MHAGAYTGTNALSHTNSLLFSGFHGNPWWRTGEFKDRYVCKWVLMVLHVQWSTLSHDSQKQAQFFESEEDWKAYNPKTWHMLVFVCWPAVNSLHLQTMLCLHVSTSEWECVYTTCLAACTYRKRHKNKHAPIWSVIRRPDFHAWNSAQKKTLNKKSKE